MIAKNPTTERLFFALWPEESVRSALAELRDEVALPLKGQPTTTENLHLTLAFIGHVNAVTKRCLQQVAAKVQSDHFALTLDMLGYWPNSGILWLGTRQVPLTLQNLVHYLTTELQVCGYSPENRPYHAHLTLMRKAACTKTLPNISPIHWPINDFCLVRSLTERQGVVYQVINRWALR
jgi:2'-5' RNA ligase